MVNKLINLISTFTSLSRQCFSLLRSNNFDISTIEGRSRKRYRRAVLTSITLAAGKGVTILIMLISVPLTLNYLGPERYGMWMTISSIVAMLGFADLGIGLGLMNVISQSHATDDRQHATIYVSSGFFLLSGIAFVILLVFALAYHLISWPRIFNVESALAMSEAGPATAAFMVFFAINLPLGVVQRVQMGYQEGYVNIIWETVGRVVSLIALLIVIYFKAGLVWLVSALAGAQPLANLCNGLFLFNRKYPCLMPKWRHAVLDYGMRLLRIGIFLFVLNLIVTIIYSADNLIAAHVLGAEAVTQYAIPCRMFSLALLVMNMIIAPLWPAYSEALASGDILWARKTFMRSIKLLLLLVGAVSLLLVFFGPQILHIWVGPSISPSFSLLLGFALWTIIMSLSSAMSIILNAANLFRFQVIFLSLTLVVSLILKIFLARAMGVSGIVWGTVIAMSIFFIFPYAIYISRFFSQWEQRCLS